MNPTSHSNGATAVTKRQLAIRKAVLFLTLALVTGCGSRQQQPNVSSTMPAVVKTVRVEANNIEDQLAIPARVQPDPTRVVRIYPPAGGRLVRVDVRPGDHVHKGEPVALLESADVAQARADYAKAKTETERTHHAFDRAKLLFDHKVLSEREYEDADAIRNILLATPDGSKVPLGQVAEVRIQNGAFMIYRENDRRYIPIKFSVRGRDLSSTMEEVQARLAREIQLPKGYHYEWAGEYDSLKKEQKRLMIVLPITLGVIPYNRDSIQYFRSRWLCFRAWRCHSRRTRAAQRHPPLPAQRS